MKKKGAYSELSKRTQPDEMHAPRMYSAYLMKNILGIDEKYQLGIR